MHYRRIDYPQPDDHEDGAILKRRLPHLNERAARFIAPGERTATELLDAMTNAGVQVGYLCRPPNDLDWWTAPLDDGWELTQWHDQLDRRTAVYRRGIVTRELRLATSWFDDDADATVADRAWKRLGVELRNAVTATAVLMATPAMTGLELLEAVLPFQLAVPTLPLATREYLWRHGHQGRIELLDAPTDPILRDRPLRGLWNLDARWMYAACCSHLPIGQLVDDHKNEFAGFTPGFYQVTATVPRDWAHIGLLPREVEPGEKTSYPRTPRLAFDSFCSGAELDVAIQQGWQVIIHRRLLWPQTGRPGFPDVARPWIEKLRVARQRLTSYAVAGDPAAQLAAGAVRHIQIDSVGRWFSRETERHGMLPVSQISQLPAGAVPHLEGDRVLYSLPAQLDPKLERFSHPEWAATVWGRARARLARRALELPFDRIVALRTDAIWTATRPDAPEYATDAPGSWRVKSYVVGPLDWPASEAELLDVMRAAR